MPLKDKEANRLYKNKWALQDYHKNKEKYSEYRRLLREKNPALRLINSTKKTAKNKKIEHNITVDDLILPEYCPYLNVKIDYSAGNGKSMFNPSIDRIDPLQGYVKGNVEVISVLANVMKNKATVEQLQTFAMNVLRRHPIE